MPGISVTMARSCSSSRLNRLLLPTFGRPDDGQREALRAPGRRIGSSRPAARRPRGPASRRRRISAAGATLTSSSAKSMPASSSAISSSKLLLQRRDAARDRAIHLLRRDARLVERGGFDQVADRFGLRQVDAAVQEGAQREFAGFGQARSRGCSARCTACRSTTGEPWQEISIRSSAVYDRGRCEEGDDHLVDRVALAHRAVRPGARCQGCHGGGRAGIASAMSRGVGAGKAHDPEAAAARGSGDGDDGVVRGCNAERRSGGREDRRDRRRDHGRHAATAIAIAARRPRASRSTGRGHRCGAEASGAGGSGRLAMPAG